MDELVGRYRTEPAALLTLMVELVRVLGPLTAAALAYVAASFKVPLETVTALANAHDIARGERERPLLGICANASCAARGGAEVERVLAEKGVPYEVLRCQGACDLGPIACYHRGAPLAISAARARTLAKATPADWEDLLSVEKPVHAFKTEPRVAYANVFSKGSHQLATAKRHGVYAPVESALKRPPEEILAALEESGLIAAEADGGPVASRWRAVREAEGPRYVVVDAVEREPGTSKDRVLVERDPHLVVAGATLAAHAVGASEVYLCVRGEYELAIERIRAAVEDAGRTGFLGENVAGTGVPMRVRVRLVPGASLAAEPAPLLRALEGMPPQPAPGDVRLFGRPTLVENVETICSLPAIVAKGGAWYRGLGLNGAVGTKVVCAGGDVKRPGSYEVPRGTPLRAVVEELAGGLGQGKTLVALQVGRAAAPFLPAALLDAPLDDAALAPHGATVGSGAVIVFTERSCLADVCRRELAFLGREGCGHCEACQSAIPQLTRAMEAGDLQGVESALAGLAGASGCALGRRAQAAVGSLVRHFPESFVQHRDGLCPCSPKKRARPS